MHLRIHDSGRLVKYFRNIIESKLWKGEGQSKQTRTEENCDYSVLYKNSQDFKGQPLKIKRLPNLLSFKSIVNELKHESLELGEKGTDQLTSCVCKLGVQPAPAGYTQLHRIGVALAFSPRDLKYLWRG